MNGTQTYRWRWQAGLLGLSVRTLLLVAAVLLPAAAPAQAAVEVSFYSKELGVSFPHTFVRVVGIVDRTGETIDTNYGFTAKTITPAVLLGSVPGEIVASKPEYVAKSDRHFSLIVSDEEYDRLLATAAKWRDRRQPSYNLNSRNCVFFVAEMAEALGMKADTPRGLMKKPRSYVQHLLRINRTWLESRNAVFTNGG